MLRLFSVFILLLSFNNILFAKDKIDIPPSEYIEKVIRMYPNNQQESIRKKILSTPPNIRGKIVQKLEKDAKELNKNIVERKKAKRLKIDLNKKTNSNKISIKNRKIESKNEDKVNKLILLIEKMNEEEAKLKKKEIEKKKKSAGSDIIFTPLKSIRVGGRIYVDVEISFKKTSFIKKLVKSAKAVTKKADNTPPPKPGNNKKGKQVKAKPVIKNKTAMVKKEELTPSKVYTLTVGDQIEDWKVIRATDRFIIFENVKTEKKIKEYY